MKDPNNFHYAYLTYPIGEWEVDFIIYFYVPQDNGFSTEIIEIEPYSLKKSNMYFDKCDIISGFASEIIESLLMDKYKGDEKFHEAIHDACYQSFTERNKTCGGFEI